MTLYELGLICSDQDGGENWCEELHIEAANETDLRVKIREYLIEHDEAPQGFLSIDFDGETIDEWTKIPEVHRGK